jgi:hypothetical protein
MSSRRDSPAARERRVRRVAGRHGLDLLKPERRDARVAAHGGYMLREAASGRIVLGAEPYRFSQSLEEVEAWLERLDGAEAGAD